MFDLIIHKPHRPSGSVIAVDTTLAMLARGKASAEECNVGKSITWLHASLDGGSGGGDGDGGSDRLPNDAADVVVSNGVFNLCVDKAAAFRTAFVMTKPGGQFVLSDVCKEFVGTNYLADLLPFAS